jgi:hypothetical protein
MRLLNLSLGHCVLLASGLAGAVWGCQSPDAFYRELDAGITFKGTGGSSGAGTGGAMGIGGMGLGGRTGGTGGKISGTGGLATGSGGAVSGTGGAIAGTGGAIAGTGGAVSGTGGSTVMDAGTVTPCTSCLEVLAQCEASSNPQEFKFVLELVNQTSMSIAYSDITVRYWYKADVPSDTPTFTLDFAQNVGGDVTGTSGISGANQYVEIGFTTAAGSLASNGNSGQIQCRFDTHDLGWNTSQADDYSFMGCPTSSTYTMWNKITAYVDGALAWGVEPP